MQRAKRKPKQSSAQRAAILVGMLEDYFAECGQRVETWSLMKAEEGAGERGITGYGAGGFRHTVAMHRGDALAAEFDMAISRAAAANGSERHSLVCPNVPAPEINALRRHRKCRAGSELF